MRNYINLEKLIKIIVLMILSFFMIYAVVSRKIQNYVNPRMNAVVIVTAVILIFIAIFTIPDLKRKKHTIFVKDYVILLLPLLVACVVPYNTYDSQQQINLEGSFSTESSSLGSVKKADDNKNTENQEDTEKKEESKKAVNPMVKNNQTLTITDDDYAQLYLRISGDMEYYEGQRIKIKGQFFKTKDFSSSEFVLARMAMVCCAADLQPCGFLYKYKDLDEYKSGEWLSVTGTIHIEDYKGEKMPVVHVEKITKAEAAKEKYIYFNGN